jgi:hypothetical protein
MGGLPKSCPSTIPSGPCWDSIQQACGAAGLEVSDRVQVHFEAASDEVRAALG